MVKLEKPLMEKTVSDLERKKEIRIALDQLVLRKDFQNLNRMIRILQTICREKNGSVKAQNLCANI